MSRPYVGDYLNSLHQQIYTSVERIKRNTQILDFTKQDSENNNATSSKSRVEKYAYKLLAEDTIWSLQTNNITSQESSYITSSYQSAKDVMQEPTILMDFMFKNNREFDFKV